MTPEQFKQKRKELGLTQRELAKALGLAKNGDVYIRRIEKGGCNPSGVLLRAMEMLLEIRELEKREKFWQLNTEKLNEMINYLRRLLDDFTV